MLEDRVYNDYVHIEKPLDRYVDSMFDEDENTQRKAKNKLELKFDELTHNQQENKTACSSDTLMKLLDKYIKSLFDSKAGTIDPFKIKKTRKQLCDKIRALVNNQFSVVSSITYSEIYNPYDRVPSKKYVPCRNCEGWGCYSCCSSEQEIMGRQGTFG
jgi:hypothetical protein